MLCKAVLSQVQNGSHISAGLFNALKIHYPEHTLKKGKRLWTSFPQFSLVFNQMFFIYIPSSRQAHFKLIAWRHQFKNELLALYSENKINSVGRMKYEIALWSICALVVHCNGSCLWNRLRCSWRIHKMVKWKSWSRNTQVEIKERLEKHHICFAYFHCLPFESTESIFLGLRVLCIAICDLICQIRFPKFRTVLISFYISIFGVLS